MTRSSEYHLIFYGGGEEGFPTGESTREFIHGQWGLELTAAQ